jgi:glycerol-3-phosphate acyltransferase PlsX
MKIALDAMGGDLAPRAVIEGAILAARDLGVEIVLVGNRDIIARELAEHRTRGLTLEIEHAAEVVAMDDSPLDSVLTKPESSIHVGLEMVKQGRADGFVSAGNSGAVMAAAMAILETLPGVDRPAIASLVPTTAGVALLIDAGANTEVKPIHLVQFAVMGSVYWHHVYNTGRPRVGILSNGEEASKGTDLTRAAAAVLAQMDAYVNYVGYVEGRDINRARADVVVTDGFTGNVALKTMEGFASFMLGNLRDVLTSGVGGRLAYLMIRRKLGALRERLDPSEYGGAPLLGVNGVTIIAHGSSNARAIRNAVRAAANEALVRHVNTEIVEILSRSPDGMTVKPSGKGIRGLFVRMRERLHLHREGHPERKSEKPAKGEKPPLAADKSEKTEKSGRPEAAPQSAAKTGSLRPAAPEKASLGEKSSTAEATPTAATPSASVPGSSENSEKPNRAEKGERGEAAAALDPADARKAGAESAERAPASPRAMSANGHQGGPAERLANGSAGEAAAARSIDSDSHGAKPPLANGLIVDSPHEEKKGSH